MMWKRVKRWLRIRWYRIKRRFGWMPEWQKKIMNQKLQPDRIIMSEDTYNDLVEWLNADTKVQLEIPIESPEPIPDSINLKVKVK